MSLRYYMDHHVPSSITEGLRSREVDCVTAEEDGRAALADDQLLMRSTALDRVLFTMDVDFLEVCSECWASGTHFSGVAYARQLGITIGQAIRELHLMAEVLDPPDLRDQLYRLPIT